MEQAPVPVGFRLARACFALSISASGGRKQETEMSGRAAFAVGLVLTVLEENRTEILSL